MSGTARRPARRRPFASLSLTAAYPSDGRPASAQPSPDRHEAARLRLRARRCCPAVIETEPWPPIEDQRDALEGQERRQRDDERRDADLRPQPAHAETDDDAGDERRRDASDHGQPCRSSSTAMMAAHRPPVVPADRSISPSSRTKIRPIAMMMIGPAWMTSASMLYALRKPWCTIAKKMVITIRPTERRDRTEFAALDAAAVVPRCTRSACRRRVRRHVRRRRIRRDLVEIMRCACSYRRSWLDSADDRPISPERPAVISSTIWVCVTSLRRTCAAIRPR